MPKVLSVKKSQTQSSKGQKAITHFFKAAPNNCSSTQSIPVKQELNFVKRKATSPVLVESICNSTAKFSPIKENIIENHVKRCKIQKKCLVEDTKTVLDKSVLDDLVDKSCSNDSALNRRSPLTAIYNENHDKSKLSCKNIESELSSMKLLRTPEKCSKNGQSRSFSPKSLVEKSPRRKCRNKSREESSPSKCGSTIKLLEFDIAGENTDLFADEWDLNQLNEDTREDLDLTIMQRCEVLSVMSHPTKLELRLKNNVDNQCTCSIEGVWMNTPIQSGEIISILASKNSAGQYFVNNNYGLLSLRPDHLISTTSVVAGVFCKRKAVLQERWKGIDSANVAMTIGILIHELVQKALTQNIRKASDLRQSCADIINESLHMLYDAGITETEAKTNMEQYITPLQDFMQTYYSKNQMHNKPKWNGRIENVLDIEENMCCPELGLKGKIDATLQVTIHDKKGESSEIVPLELKSGKASGSVEHRGQLVLYGMMMSIQRNEDPAITIQRGLLLYLKEQVDVREVSCGYPERRDLLLLRNELVQHLASGPQSVKTELMDIEDAAKMLQQSLPEPVHHHNACSKCPYLTICSLHLWHTNDVIVSETHPLAKLRDTALGHLSSTHVSYFLHWTSLLKLEEMAQMSNSPLHALWTVSPENRAQRGTCSANLKLISVKRLDDRYAHVFEKMNKDIENHPLKGPKEGEFSIVSLDARPWIAAGVVTLTTKTELHINLERNLSLRHNKNTVFHIDTYESYATTVQNLTNLGVLMEDSDRALRLRKLIIEKDEPEFIEKLPREVGRLGSKLMRNLNIEQQRAVLKALSCNDYVLLQGLPGTGKTQTISVLIQMLVCLKQRVLVTAHTHSAVDTVLTSLRLPESLKIMRLGSSSRVAHNLAAKSEATLTKNCNTSEELSKLYDSMDVVGVTCLGANHALLSRTTFDVCIVDEATQVLQCTVIRPLLAAKRFVLVGDPEQLPPVVKSKSARRLGMEESLFHRLMGDKSTCTLQLQYRMNQALVDIANKVAYNERLKCANKSVAKSTMNIDDEKLSALDPWEIEACSKDVEKAALFFNVQPIETKYHKGLTNTDEGCVVLALVKLFIQVGVKSSDIGVIAPYRDQVSLLRQMLATTHVEVSTVDQFQGRDKSVIIYSCTKRNSFDDKVKDGEVLNDQRRLAVCVTRAKHKFIAIGNEQVLRKYTPLSKLIDACKQIVMDKNILLELIKQYKSVM
ncbi:DNA replication ATP-dependent helicase/nuclease DNA2 isoform X1 [Pieris rapae]|uniref:DNA replication ATP-dependent helicase/nuclease DNA2 isoform X1 n=1 Tax=Pieris rapae TaxID=64459 RepID=UPI001E27DBFC|nr:DNA replication ATP-dependent helicase/nuclease DNA2 isoform X1 [Pieris rapae]